jgi:hypothetical protein
VLASERSGGVPWLTLGLLDALFVAVRIERYGVAAGTLGAPATAR